LRGGGEVTARARADKASVVEYLREKVQKSQVLVLTDYRGLDVAAMNQLRQKLRERGIEYRVVKNTLFARAVSELNLEGIMDFLTGPTAVAFGYDDPVVPAKVLVDFGRQHPQLQIKGGLLDGSLIDRATVIRLAELPSRQELLQATARGLQSPLAAFARALNGLLSGFVRVVDELRKKKTEQAA